MRNPFQRKTQQRSQCCLKAVGNQPSRNVVGKDRLSHPVRILVHQQRTLVQPFQVSSPTSMYQALAHPAYPVLLHQTFRQPGTQAPSSTV